MTQPTNPEYHWTPAQMRQFLEALAETGTISVACESVGKSRRAAYNLRFREQGRAFGMGWDAALLVARACLADVLMERAIAGYTTVSQRDPGSGTITSQRVDNRCAMGMLQRLDRMTGLGAAPQAGSDAALARIVAQDFWHFLDLVESGGQGSEAALFVAARSPAPGADDALDCELADEWDDASEVEYGPEEEVSPQEQAAQMTVWWNEWSKKFQTDFPPPLDFYGTEHGQFGSDGYSRDLDEDEAAAQEEITLLLTKPLRHAGHQARKAWLSLPEKMQAMIDEALEPGNLEPDAAEAADVAA